MREWLLYAVGVLAVAAAAGAVSYFADVQGAEVGHHTEVAEAQSSRAAGGPVSVLIERAVAMATSGPAVAPTSVRAGVSDCFVSSEAPVGGPAAPTQLEADLALVPPDPQAYAVDLTWADNAADEICYVVERRLSAYVAHPPYETVAILPANSTSYRDPGPYAYELGHNGAFYRVYAATEIARSEYSNEDGVAFPPYDVFPTRTPTPSPSPTLSPTVTVTPAPSTPTATPLTATPTVTPGQLPLTGSGGGDGPAAGWALPGGAILAGIAIAAAVIAFRPSRPWHI